ncbi:hypothetical protein MKW92_048436 [Papaver armeniacum]|nr:hypothetical protein MKW92_048436 [Papaver armeniacum]
MTSDKKARYVSESKKAYIKRHRKNRKEKARLQKFQIVRSEEEEANEITTSGMTRDKKARLVSESKKAYIKRRRKKRKEKARLQKFQIVRSEEEEANEITTSGYIFLSSSMLFDLLKLASNQSFPTVEELEINKLEHDPSSNSTSTSIPEEDLEELMTSIKKDPCLKPILEDQVMTRGKGRYSTESKKAYKRKLKKNKREKARLQKFQIVRSEEEEANEITASGLFVEEVEISKPKHDPSSKSTCASISEEDLEELMTSIKKDPYLKPILEDIEIGGPTVMMRYLNDSEVFQKLAQAMGFGVLEENVSSVEGN